MIKPYFLFLILFLWRFSVYTQVITLSLQECINCALENNIQVKREKLKTLKQDNELQKARYSFLPEVKAGSAHEYSSGYSLNDFSYEYAQVPINSGYLGIESNLLLFNGLQRVNNIKQNEFKLEATLADYHQFRNNIILEVSTAYFQVLLNKELLEMSKGQLEITKQQVKKTGQLVDAGSLAKGEFLKIKALEASENLNVINSKNDLDFAFLTLFQLLEMDTSQNIDIYTPNLPDIKTYPINDIDLVYRQALENLPLIKKSKLNIESQEAALKSVRGRSFPEIEMGTMYQSWYIDDINGEKIPMVDQVNNHKQFLLFINVSIPIFNRMENNKAVSNAKIDLLDAEYNHEYERKVLYKLIQQSHANAKAALNKYNAALEAVIANEEAFKYTEQKFNVGLITSVDYNLSKNELQKARAELLIAKYDYFFKLKTLDFYSGKPFTL